MQTVVASYRGANLPRRLATKLTFGEPVKVPGRVLEAEMDWSKLADSPSDRNIVEILER